MKKQQKGMGSGVVFFLLMVFVVILIGCSGSSSGDSDESGNGTSSVVYVENFGIQIPEWDPSTDCAGDVAFDNSHKPFTFFGEAKNGSSQRTPELGFITKKNVYVTAITDCTVEAVEYQPETVDYSVRMTCGSFDTDQDHIKNPTVKIGDAVNAKTVIGQVADWWVNDKFGVTELQINVKDENQIWKAHCIWDYFNPNTKSDNMARITQLMKDWEKFTKDTSQFDENNSYLPGCVVAVVD